MAKREYQMGDSANNVQLKWNDEKDRPAIEALRKVARELGNDAKSALRFMCVASKTHAIKKAKEIKKIMQAS